MSDGHTASTKLFVVVWMLGLASLALVGAVNVWATPGQAASRQTVPTRRPTGTPVTPATQPPPTEQLPTQPPPTPPSPTATATATRTATLTPTGTRQPQPTVIPTATAEATRPAVPPSPLPTVLPTATTAPPSPTTEIRPLPTAAPLPTPQPIPQPGGIDPGCVVVGLAALLLLAILVGAVYWRRRTTGKDAAR